MAAGQIVGHHPSETVATLLHSEIITQPASNDVDANIITNHTTTVESTLFIEGQKPNNNTRFVFKIVGMESYL